MPTFVKFEGLTNLDKLKSIAKMAYGSGRSEKECGGKGNIGLLNGYVIKWNTHSFKRDNKNQLNTQHQASLELSSKIYEIAQSLGLREDELQFLYRKLGLSEPATQVTDGNGETNSFSTKSLLDRKCVAQSITYILEKVNKSEGSSDLQAIKTFWEEAVPSRKFYESEKDMSFKTVFGRVNSSSTSETISDTNNQPSVKDPKKNSEESIKNSQDDGSSISSPSNNSASTNQSQPQRKDQVNCKPHEDDGFSLFPEANKTDSAPTVQSELTYELSEMVPIKNSEDDNFSILPPSNEANSVSSDKLRMPTEVDVTNYLSNKFADKYGILKGKNVKQVINHGAGGENCIFASILDLGVLSDEEFTYKGRSREISTETYPTETADFIAKVRALRSECFTAEQKKIRQYLRKSSTELTEVHPLIKLLAGEYVKDNTTADKSIIAFQYLDALTKQLLTDNFAKNNAEVDVFNGTFLADFLNRPVFIIQSKDSQERELCKKAQNNNQSVNKPCYADDYVYKFNFGIQVDESNEISARKLEGDPIYIHFNGKHYEALRVT